MNDITIVNRRTFLGGLVSASALLLGARIMPSSLKAASDAESAAWSPGIFLGIEPDGTTIIIAHRSEMGTGIRTALPAVVADELDADWSRVRIEQAIGDAKYGSQNTDGSQSIRDFYDIMREAGATARHMLIAAAAEKWGVPASECNTDNHSVVHAKSNRKASYGSLVGDAKNQPLPKKEDLKFKSPDNYKFIGKDMAVSNIKELCSGRGMFGIDTHVPGMVHASIERSPVLGGQLKNHDDTETLKVKGVQQTVVLESFKGPHGFQALGGVAVIADNTWSAIKGREALQVDWDPGANAAYNSDEYKKQLIDTVSKPQKRIRNVGNVDTEFSKNSNQHEAHYYVPHLAHAPMEPPAAVAEIKGDKAIIHTCTQNPQAVQDTVAAALGIDKTNVECHVTLLGGGFGRKSKPDYVAEAALLARKLGKPVKVTWTREDDLQFDYFHSVAAMYLKASVDGKGRPTAMLQRSAFPTIISTFNGVGTEGAPFELGMGWTDNPFAIPNIRAENGPAKHHVRIGWLRSVSNIYHAFALQSFVDELAARANRDRVEYLLDLLGEPRKIDFKAEGTDYPNYGKSIEKYPLDTGRLRNVIELAAEKSGWANKKSGNGRGFGIAAHRSFLSYVATVVEVETASDGSIKIPRIDVAVDVGMAISPDRVRSQFEGGAVFGASIALMGEITATNGVIDQTNFDTYPVARMSEAPRQVNVHIVNSKEPPAGVGEPGVPPVPPAICNAIFAANGKRIRDLPINPVG